MPQKPSFPIHTRCLFLLFLFFLFPIRFAEGAAVGTAAAHPIISRITIRASNIFNFDVDPYLKRFPYTLINGLHVRTKEYVIREQLLFKIGDPYHEDVAQETERNLRALPFIQAARVAVFPQKDGTVALVVYTSDSWTTEPQINLSGLNGISTVEVGFKEKNFLGYGKTVEAFYETSNNNEIQRSYRYYDPNLLGSRWQLDAKRLVGSDNNDISLQLDRPFFSALTPFAGGALYENNADILPVDVNAQNGPSYERKQEISQVQAAAKIGGSRQHIHRLGLTYKREHLAYAPAESTPPGAALPEAEMFQTVYVNFQNQVIKFKKYMRLEKMTRVEDINTGPLFNLSPGVSPTAITGHANQTSIATDFTKYTQISKHGLLKTYGDYSSRNVFNSPENQRMTLESYYYLQKIERQTFVTHARYEWGNKMDTAEPISLGSENGLRGFEEEAFNGNRSLLLNVENRFYFTDELFQLFSLGGVLFYDTGYAWVKQQQAFKLSDLHSDAGAGLRIGLTKSATEMILRVDCGWRLQRKYSSDGSFFILIGTSQAF